MGLIVDLGTSKHGVDLSAAYVRFEKNPIFDYGVGTVRLRFEIFVNSASATANKAALPGVALAQNEVLRTFDPASDAALEVAAAAYAAVKANGATWPELQGAIDA